MTGTGAGNIATAMELDPVQPLLSVTVTVYVPAVLTVMDDAVDPFDQRYDAYPAAAVNVVDPPAQKPGAPAIAGTGGVNNEVSTDADAVHPPALVTVTSKPPAVVTV